MRPALVLSTRAFNEYGHTIMAMITSASHRAWPGDVLLDHTAAGLPKPCIARLKLFTLDNSLLSGHLGRLSSADIGEFSRQLHVFVLRLPKS